MQKRILTGLLVFIFVMGVSLAVSADDVPYGGWLDRIVAEEEDSTAAGVTKLGTDDLGVYADTITEADIYNMILENPEILYAESFGSYNELSFNPSGPVFPETGKLNPFSVARIREAMNWLVDREYMANEIFGGMAVPRLFPITSAFPDYAAMIEKVRELEVTYSHNPDLAEEVITEEMLALGAEMVDGVWHFEGEPVEIGILIRTEDERTEVGDYVGTLLEGIGFEVERRYATAAEASPIWLTGDPEAGRFHIYTGGWITTVVARDQATNWDFFYTTRGLGTPLWQAYEPSEEFDTAAERLAQRDFTTMEERAELMALNMELGLKDSVRIWLVDRLAVNPYRYDVELTADLAGGISGSYLWAHTIRKVDEVGGQVNVGLPSVMPEPWNPLDGSNWIFDMMLIRATGELGYMWDPYTGLHYPNMFESAKVVVEEGLPVTKTLDWIELEFAEGGTEVPEDAWADWDPVEQRFITVGEKYPEGVNARRAVTTFYPENIQQDLRWHDGSNFSTADLVWAHIMSFDRAFEDSDFYDEAQVSSYESFMDTYRGLRIIDEDPITIEYYSDLYYLDAEWYIPSLFPYFAQGQGAWHNMAIGYLAEVNEEVAYSASKADALEVEHLNMIGGPSLDIMENHLQQAMDEAFIPYENTLGEFISEEEALERYQNLYDWYQDKGHFWIGTGPYYLDAAYPVEGIVELARNEDYPFRADRWDMFVEPMIPEVGVTGPGAVRMGSDLTLDITVFFADEPYLSEDLDTVSVLVFDEADRLIDTVTAEMVEEGHWRAEISGDITSRLSFGSSTFETVVTSHRVAMPVMDALSIVTFE